MRFLLLLRGDEAAEAALSPADRRAIVEAHIEYSRRLRSDGRFVYGDPLEASSGAARIRRDGSVVDGPFPETKEALGGYYIVDVPDRAIAIELARAVPDSPGRVVDVHPIADMT